MTLQTLVCLSGISLDSCVSEMQLLGARFVCVVSSDQHLIGVLTEGDIIRIKNKAWDWNPKVDDVCNKNYVFSRHSVTEDEALSYLKETDILYLPIVDEDRCLIEVLNLVDLIINSQFFYE